MPKSIKDALGGVPFSDSNRPVLSELAAAIEYAVTSNQIVRAAWVDLLATAGGIEGQGGEVLIADAGSHSQATATGYDGAAVDNAGRYSWNATWGRWVRVGDNDLSLLATAAQGAKADSAVQPADLSAIEQSILDLSDRVTGAGSVSIDSFAIEGGRFFERGSDPAPTLNWEIGGIGSVSEIRIGATVLDPADRTWASAPISDDVTYTLTVEDAEGRAVSAQVNADLVLPVYFGAANPVDPDDMTGAEARGMAELRLGTDLQGVFEIEVVGTQYIYLVAPVSFSAPSRVRVNGFDLIDPFETDTKSISTAFGVNANYTFRRLELPYTDTILRLEIE